MAAQSLASEAKPIVMHQRMVGQARKVYVLGEWPKVARIHRIDESFGRVTNNGTTIHIEVENGTAVYRPSRQDSGGNWICERIESAFAPPPDDVSAA